MIRDIAHMTRMRGHDILIAPALFALAFGLRVTVIGLARFDGLYGQDAYAYFDYARGLATGSLSGPVYWPLGYPVLASALMVFLGAVPAAGQIASVIAGSLIAPLAYFILREFDRMRKPDPDEVAADRRAGIAAGLIVAISGQLTQSSISVMSDAPALFWATLSLWAMLRFARLQRGGWLIASAVALGIATVTRWMMGVLIVPWAIYVLLVLRDRRELRRIGPALLIYALIVLAQLRFSANTPASFSQHTWLTSWNPANALRRTFDTPEGPAEYPQPVALFNLQPLYHPFYLFPALTPLAAWGAWLQRRQREVILVAGWIAAGYLALSGIPYENFRYGLVYFTPIALLVGMGFDAAATRAARSAWIGLGVCLVAMSFFTMRGLAPFLSIKQGELAATGWLQARVPPGASVITFGLTLTLQHYTGLEAVEVYTETSTTLAARICGRAPVYAYLDVANLESQWAGLSPEINYRWLRDGPGLTALGRYQGYSLFEIGGCK